MARSAYNYPSDFYYRPPGAPYQAWRVDCSAKTDLSGGESGGCTYTDVSENKKGDSHSIQISLADGSYVKVKDFVNKEKAKIEIFLNDDLKLEDIRNYFNDSVKLAFTSVASLAAIAMTL